MGVAVPHNVVVIVNRLEIVRVGDWSTEFPIINRSKNRANPDVSRKGLKFPYDINFALHVFKTNHTQWNS